MPLKIFVNSRYPDIAPLAQTIANDGIPAEAVDIYNRRNRVARLAYGNMDICIKQFRVPHMLNRIVYGKLRHSKARRAYENALILHENGINTPEPLAYIEERSGGMLRRSYYLCRHIEGYSDLRDIEKTAGHDEIILATGQLLAELHHKGIWMKDFSAGNILWKRSEDGSLRLALVDINRMAFGVHSRKKLNTNFRTITANPVVLQDIAAAYSHYSGADPDPVLETARCERRKYLRMQRIKNILRRH